MMFDRLTNIDFFFTEEQQGRKCSTDSPVLLPKASVETILQLISTAIFRLNEVLDTMITREEIEMIEEGKCGGKVFVLTDK